MEGSPRVRGTRARLYAWCFWIFAALRFISIVPFVIDDDEAWWSASAFSLKTPWEIYRRAVDDKPPGMVWFYWLSGHLLPHGGDPRVTRALYAALTVAAALLLGWLARRFAEKKHAADPAACGWLAAAIFLLAGASASPKLLAVTSDGLLSLLVTASFAILLFADFAGAALAAGALLGAAFLTKQTAVFFALPLILCSRPRRFATGEVARCVLGTVLVVIPAIVAVGPADFLYWNWTYPRQILTAVRERIFASGSEFFWNLAVFGLATFPLLVAVARSLARSRFSVRDFRVLWLFAGILAALLGRGIFLHYFLLFVPPLALLGAEALLGESGSGKGTLAWLGVSHALGCLVLLIPGSGIFWGTDLFYFGEVGHVLSRGVKPGDSVLIWGGSPLPLVYSRIAHSTRFLVPRFAVEPYGTRETAEIFHRELIDSPPGVVLDLHERGDNRFDNPLEGEPVLSALVARRYRLYFSPTLPWAKFYFRAPPPPDSGLVEARDAKYASALYAAYPSEPEIWLQFNQLLSDPGPRQSILQNALDLDWRLRADAALELLSRQGRDASEQARARRLREGLKNETPGPEIKAEIENFMSAVAASTGIVPAPWHSLEWWPEVALVQLQPRAMGQGARRASE